MAKKAKEEKVLPWQDADVTTFKGATKAAYDDLEKAKDVVQAKREVFQEAFIADARKKKEDPLPKDKTIRFFERFGKLRVAVDDDDETKPKKLGTFKLS